MGSRGSPFVCERLVPLKWTGTLTLPPQVFVHPNSAPLWREYLLFNQSYFSSFTVSKVNAAYGKCLSTLSSVQDGSMVSHPPLPGTESHMLGRSSVISKIYLSLFKGCFWICCLCVCVSSDIFIQQCHFLRQAGHSEKAVSLFQAMIDFTFFKPDNVRKLTTKQQVSALELKNLWQFMTYLR